MRKCPFCAEDIKDEAIKCKFCGNEVEPVKPKEIINDVQVNHKENTTKNSENEKNNDSSNKKTNNSINWNQINSVMSIVNTIVGVLFILIAIFRLIPVGGNKIDAVAIFAFLFWMLIGLFLIPPINKRIQQKIKLNLHNCYVCLTSCVLFIIFAIILGFIPIIITSNQKFELNISSPDNVTVQTAEYDITGTILPMDANLTVNGSKDGLSINGNKFDYKVGLSEGNNIYNFSLEKNTISKKKSIIVRRELTEEEKAKIEEEKRKQIEEENRKKAEEEQKKKDAEEAKKHKVGDVVMIDDVVWGVLEVKDRGDTLYASESQYPSIMSDLHSLGGKFIEVRMAVTNDGKNMKTLNTSSFRLIDDKGREYQSKTEANEWIPHELQLFLLDNLNPGIPRAIVVIYEVPTDAVGLKMEVDNLSFWGNKKDVIWLGL